MNLTIRPNNLRYLMLKTQEILVEVSCDRNFTLPLGEMKVKYSEVIFLCLYQDC